MAQAVVLLMNSTGNYKKPITIKDIMPEEGAAPKRKGTDKVGLEAMKNRFGRTK